MESSVITDHNQRDMIHTRDLAMGYFFGRLLKSESRIEAPPAEVLERNPLPLAYGRETYVVIGDFT